MVFVKINVFPAFKALPQSEELTQSRLKHLLFQILEHLLLQVFIPIRSEVLDLLLLYARVLLQYVKYSSQVRIVNILDSLTKLMV